MLPARSIARHSRDLLHHLDREIALRDQPLQLVVLLIQDQEHVTLL
jgi:hypothetical protein